MRMSFRMFLIEIQRNVSLLLWKWVRWNRERKKNKILKFCFAEKNRKEIKWPLNDTFVWMFVINSMEIVPFLIPSWSGWPVDPLEISMTQLNHFHSLSLSLSFSISQSLNLSISIFLSIYRKSRLIDLTIEEEVRRNQSSNQENFPLKQNNVFSNYLSFLWLLVYINIHRAVHLGNSSPSLLPHCYVYE